MRTRPPVSLNVAATIGSILIGLLGPRVLIYTFILVGIWDGLSETGMWVIGSALLFVLGPILAACFAIGFSLRIQRIGDANRGGVSSARARWAVAVLTALIAGVATLVLAELWIRLRIPL